MSQDVITLHKTCIQCGTKHDIELFEGDDDE